MDSTRLFKNKFTLEEISTYFFNNDKSISKTAKYFNANPEGIRNYLNKNNITTYLPNLLKNKYTHDEVIAYYTQYGMSLKGAAEHFNVSEDTLRFFLRKNNVTLKVQPEPKNLLGGKYTVEDVTNFYKTETKTLQNGADYFGVSPERVRLFLLENNIARKTIPKPKEFYIKNKIKDTPENVNLITNFYFEQKQSPTMICKHFNCGESAVKRFMKKHKMPLRTLSESNKLNKTCKILSTPENINLITKLYHEQKQSTYDIAKLFNCNPLPVIRFMRKNNIEIRTATETIRVKTDLPKETEQDIIDLYKEKYVPSTEIAEIYNISVDKVLFILRKNNIPIRTYTECANTKRHQLKIKTVYIEKDVLEKLYIKQKLSCSQIAELYNTEIPRILNLLKGFKIPRRTTNDYYADTKYVDRFRKCMWHRKQYTLPSGKIIPLMGYEPQFLNYVFKNNLLTEDEIVYNPKPIPYYKDNKKHHYIPDFYIPKFNLIVEIKSWYTEQLDTKVHHKEQACRDHNYNYIRILDNNFSILPTILNK